MTSNDTRSEIMLTLLREREESFAAFAHRHIEMRRLDPSEERYSLRKDSIALEIIGRDGSRRGHPRDLRRERATKSQSVQS